MKVYIVTDMEGISGIVRWEQARPGTPDYYAALPLLVGEINAAVDGAFAGGASEVVVNDGHDGGYNLTHVYADLDPRARYLTGPASNRESRGTETISVGSLHSAASEVFLAREAVSRKRALTL